jgi:predicted nucleotidyltransferase
MTPVADGILDEMVRRIVDRFEPERIYLFGSRSRGDARPDSDYDLLVVLDQFPDRRTAAVAIGSTLADMRAGKDIVVATTAEIEGEPRDCSRIVRSALREAKLLYERT